MNQNTKKDKKLKKYVYTDHRIEEIIFECEANDILEADKKYKEAIGEDPRKQSYVGVQILEITENEKTHSASQKIIPEMESIYKWAIEVLKQHYNDFDEKYLPLYGSDKDGIYLINNGSKDYLKYEAGTETEEKYTDYHGKKHYEEFFKYNIVQENEINKYEEQIWQEIFNDAKYNYLNDKKEMNKESIKYVLSTLLLKEVDVEKAVEKAKFTDTVYVFAISNDLYNKITPHGGVLAFFKRKFANIPFNNMRFVKRFNTKQEAQEYVEDKMGEAKTSDDPKFKGFIKANKLIPIPEKVIPDDIKKAINDKFGAEFGTKRLEQKKIAGKEGRPATEKNRFTDLLDELKTTKDENDKETILNQLIDLYSRKQKQEKEDFKEKITKMAKAT